MYILANSLLMYLCLDIVLELSIRYKNISLYVNIFILSIITGTMYEKIGAGGDYDIYRNGFNSISSAIVPDKELGFYYLNILIKKFTDEYSIAFFIFIFIINLLIVKTIYKYSKNIEFSLLMYVVMGGYFTATNITRQFIALSIYFYSVQYLIDTKYIKYLIFGLISLQFHTTSIVAVIIGFIVRILNEKLDKHYLIYFIVINMFIIVEPLIREIGMDLFYEQYEGGDFFYGSNILHYIVQLAFVLFYMINIKKIRNNETKVFVNLATVSSAFTLLSRNMVLYARLSSYFNIFHIIAVVNIMNEVENQKEKRLIYYCIFIGLLIYYNLLTKKSFILESYIIDYFTKPVYID